MPQKALITGITGQTGSYLARHLLRLGYEIHGTTRSVKNEHWRLNYLNISKDVELHELADNDTRRIAEITARQFDSIFHLAAESSVANSLRHPAQTVESNVLQTTIWLEAMKTNAPETRFFNALTSEVLKASGDSLDESSPRSATNPYAVTKLAALNMAHVFRDSFGLYIVNGLLFNHESELRDSRFVTGKIVSNLCRLAQDRYAPAFELGNVLAERDFSHAEDFAKGIVASLLYKTPQDYVFASGVLKTVKDFFNIAAQQLGFKPEWEGEGLDMLCRDRHTSRVLVTINPDFYRPIDEVGKIGNAFRARTDLGWEPQISFESLIERMIAFHKDKT